MSDLMMPFSVPLTANAGSFQLVSRPEHQNGHGPGNVGLPVGVSMVRVVWDGETGIRARLETPTRTGPYFTMVPSVGAAVRRASAPIEIPVQEAGTFLRFQVTRSIPAGDADLARVCGVTVVTTPALSAGGA